MAMKNLEDLLQHMLKDIYYAEKQIEKELPKMAKKASSEDLRAAFEQHLEETHQHVANLEAAFDELGMAKRGEKCDAIDGILKEAKSVMDEIEDRRGARRRHDRRRRRRSSTTRSPATARSSPGRSSLATTRSPISRKQNLDQEEAADRKLTELAEGSLNRMAA